MAERSVTIKILGDASKAKSAFGDAGQAAGTFEGKIEGLGSKWGTFGSVLGGVVAGGALQSMGGWLKDGAQGAADDEAAMGRLEQAVTNTGASWDDYAGSVDDTIKKGQELGFTDGETADALALLTSLTGDADEAQRRLSTAQDLSRGTGMDLLTASKLLGRVSDENTSVLSRYGIKVAEGATAQDLLNSVDGKFKGQAAKYAASDAGKWEKLTQQFGEVQESIGGVLIPAFSALADAASGIMTALDPVISFISGHIKPILIGLAAALMVIVVPAFVAWALAAGAAALATVVAMAPVLAVAAAVGIAVAALYLAWESNFLGIRDIVMAVIGFIGPYITTAIAAIQVGIGVALDAIKVIWDAVWNGLQVVIAAVWPIVQAAVEVAIAAIRLAIETALAAIQAVWGVVWPAIQAVVETVFPIIRTVVETYIGIVKTVIETVIGAIRDNWQTVWDAVRGIAETVWGAIKTVIETAVGAVRDVVGAVVGVIRDNWATVWGAIRDTAETIWGGIKTIVETAIGAVRDTIGSVTGAISDAWSTAWGGIKDALDTAWNAGLGIVGIVATGIGAVKTTISNAYEGITGAWSRIWDTITGAIGSAKDKILGILRDIIGAANGVIDKINGCIGGVNDALSFSFGVGPFDMPGPIPDIPGMTLSVNAPDIPTIPRLAAGGIVTDPTLALIGEAGPEAVIPLNRLGRTGGGVNVNYYGPVTIEATDRADAERASRDIGWAVSASLRARGVA